MVGIMRLNYKNGSKLVMEEDRNEMAHSTSCKHYGTYFGGPENGESRSQRARFQTIALAISFWGHHIPPEIC